MESRIRLKESGIPLTIGIWNLIKLESSTWNPESTARSPESKTAWDFLTRGEEKKNWEKLGMALIVEKGLYRSDVNKACLFRDVPLYKGVGALSDLNKVSIGFLIPVLNSL